MSFTLPIAQTLTFAGGAGRLFVGPFLEAHSPGGDNTFVHAQVSVRL